MAKPDYDTTIARMAGNIAAGLVRHDDFAEGLDGMHGSAVGETPEGRWITQAAVSIARAIVAEVKRTALAFSESSPETKEP